MRTGSGSSKGPGSRLSPHVTEVIVLCYHALSPTWEATLSTTPERFERQVALLARRGYRGVTFEQATRLAPGTRAVAVTFDDAYRSVIELAYPILERHGLPATVFAPTDFIGSERPMQWDGIDHWLNTPDAGELTPMSWEELASLTRAGWEIGSHTCSHPHLPAIDDAALADELARSKAACEERLGRPCNTLAYPYGDVDRRVAQASARAGYGAVAGLRGMLSREATLGWPRIGIYNRDEGLRFRLKVSALGRRLRGSSPPQPLAAASHGSPREQAAG